MGWDGIAVLRSIEVKGENNLRDHKECQLPQGTFPSLPCPPPLTTDNIATYVYVLDWQTIVCGEQRPSCNEVTYVNKRWVDGNSKQWQEARCSTNTETPSKLVYYLDSFGGGGGSHDILALSRPCPSAFNKSLSSPHRKSIVVSCVNQW